jgi:hypothetical protein
VKSSCEHGKVHVFSVKGRTALNYLNNLKFSRILICAVNYLNMLLLRIITEGGKPKGYFPQSKLLCSNLKLEYSHVEIF